MNINKLEQCTVEPPNKGQARFTSYGLCREVGLYSESMHINLELM